MNSRLSWQQFKVLLFVQSLFALLLAGTGKACASVTDIRDTNYSIPRNAYFVSPSGRDTNSGRNSDSPLSVVKALEKAPSGATIVFLGGTYRNIDSLAIRKKLTLQPSPHAKVWLKGSVVVTDWDADGRIWRKDGWTKSFPKNVGDEFIAPSHPLAGNRDMVYINGVSLRQVARKDQVVSGTFYVDDAQSKLYIGNNPSGKTVEATALKQAFFLAKVDSSNPSDTIIRGLGFAHFADAAIGVGAPRVTLEKNTFVWNGVEGVTFWGSVSGRSGITTDAIVRSNTFSYNGRKGLGGSKAHRMLLENNTISYNNVERFDKGWDAAGVKFVRTNALIWRNNLVENNFANGMWIDESCTNSTVVRNTVRNNERYGIFFEISHRAIIAANVVYNNLSGIHSSNSSSARVYNNTLVKNVHNLHIDDSPRNNTDPEAVAAGITWIARDHVVKNNILSNPLLLYDSLLFDASSCSINVPSARMFSDVDYNGYYRKSSTEPRKAIRWSVTRGTCSPYATVDAFNSATGFEEHAVAVDNVATNPFFVDEADDDYRLKSGSRAIGRGAPLPTDIARAIGLRPGVRVDLGAIQSRTVLSSN